jgi:mannose-6-phosphate isomerase-like protein (cupin superfamily)
LTVMSGEGRCLIDGEEVTVRRGQSVAIDPDHALPVTNISDRELKMIHLVFRGAADAGILRREVLMAAPRLGPTQRTKEAI